MINHHSEGLFKVPHTEAQNGERTHTKSTSCGAQVADKFFEKNLPSSSTNRIVLDSN